MLLKIKIIFREIGEIFLGFLWLGILFIAVVIIPAFILLAETPIYAPSNAKVIVDIDGLHYYPDTLNWRECFNGKNIELKSMTLKEAENFGYVEDKEDAREVGYFKIYRNLFGNYIFGFLYKDVWDRTGNWLQEKEISQYDYDRICKS